MHELVDGVAVVGGGLAGLALAAQLRLQGRPVEVLEAGQGPPPGSERGVCLWGGALAALERLGVAGTVEARGAPIRWVQVWSGSGRLLLDLAAGSDLPGGAVAVRHGALLEILAAACAGVPIHHGQRLIGYAEDAQGLMLTCHGGWNVRAPVLVGADGGHSTVRQQCLDDGSPSYSGDSVWDGITAGLPGLDPGTMHLFWAPHGLRAGAMAIDRSGSWAWWVDDATGMGAAREPGPVKPELRVLLSGLRGPLPLLIDATPEEAIGRTDVMARRRPGPPGSGRVTLAGDAWHPLPISMRMGGSLALEDAAALAQALTDVVDPIDAFRAYEQVRLPRVAWAGRAVWRLRFIETRFAPLATWLRDLGVRRLGPQQLVSALLVPLLTGQSPPPAAAPRAWRRPSWV